MFGIVVYHDLRGALARGNFVTNLIMTHVQLFPVVGWVKQVIPEKISTLARNLEEVSEKLTKKLSREVETEINELNELLALQDQVHSTILPI